MLAAVALSRPEKHLSPLVLQALDDLGLVDHLHQLTGPEKKILESSTISIKFESRRL